MSLRWEAKTKRGSKEESLLFIKEMWTDMRPISLRRQMEQADHSADAFC